MGSSKTRPDLTALIILGLLLMSTALVVAQISSAGWKSGGWFTGVIKVAGKTFKILHLGLLRSCHQLPPLTEQTCLDNDEFASKMPVIQLAEWVDAGKAALALLVGLAVLQLLQVLVALARCFVHPHSDTVRTVFWLGALLPALLALLVQVIVNYTLFDVAHTRVLLFLVPTDEGAPVVPSYEAPAWIMGLANALVLFVLSFAIALTRTSQPHDSVRAQMRGIVGLLLPEAVLLRARLLDVFAVLVGLVAQVLLFACLATPYSSWYRVEFADESTLSYGPMGYITQGLHIPWTISSCLAHTELDRQHYRTFNCLGVTLEIVLGLVAVAQLVVLTQVLFTVSSREKERFRRTVCLCLLVLSLVLLVPAVLLWPLSLDWTPSKDKIDAVLAMPFIAAAAAGVLLLELLVLLIALCTALGKKTLGQVARSASSAHTDVFGETSRLLSR